MVVQDCEVITEPERCQQLWSMHGRASLPFENWDLRVNGAEDSGVRPYFLRHYATGTVLPLGLSENTAVFFGGKIYSERNGFIGPKGGEAALLESLVRSDKAFRLLSWNDDPLGLTSTPMSTFEVPYNQYWIADPFPDVETYAAGRIQQKHVKEFRYLLRKFEFADCNPPTWQACAGLLEGFFGYTMQSFAKRNARSIYQDDVARGIIFRTCEKAHERDALRMTILFYKSEPCGLAVFVDERDAERATYLLNLYAPSPSDISNGVTCAVIRYACKTGKPIDGLRGSFTLKKKFGFRPEPSFALVRDPSWIVRPQSDLSPSEMLALYGRSIADGS